MFSNFSMSKLITETMHVYILHMYVLVHIGCKMIVVGCHLSPVPTVCSGLTAGRVAS